MTRVAKVSGAEAEENGDGAAIAAFILEKVGPVFGAHLSPRDVGTGAANLRMKGLNKRRFREAEVTIEAR